MIDCLFQPKLKRMELLGLQKNECKTHIKVNVFRNHSFEMVENIIQPFLNFSSISAEFCYSDYDDSLNFGEISTANINLIWLDLDRYKSIDLIKWLEEKVIELKSISNAPILLAYVSDNKLDITFSQTNFYHFCVNSILDTSGLYDLVKEKFSGTRLSNKACVELARIIGMKYIPAILKPAIKALVFDMDNTLYNGVLGEDGVNGIEITDTHKKIYAKMKNLKSQGFLLTIASKNEEEDVKEFFVKRKDFPFNWDDFAVIKANWELKSQNILAIAKLLNIGTDAMLFIDDNPAEIQNVESAGIEIKTMLAKTPELTLNILEYYPNLLKLTSSKEDTLRTQDIQANQTRNELVKKLSPKEYFEKLEIKLDFYINNKEHTQRITELLNKTNQFILTYARLNLAQVEEAQANGIVITINMSDKLSDSGIIAILVANRSNKGFINLQEMTVSCRALGRNLENIMLPKMFELANKHLNGNGQILINYKKGPRNMPAMNWLKDLTGQALQEEGQILYEIPADINTEGLKISEEGSVKYV